MVYLVELLGPVIAGVLLRVQLHLVHLDGDVTVTA